MRLIILIIACLIGNHPNNSKELIINCDLVEINTCFELKPDNTINYTYTQYIFYDWCPSYRRYNVIYWRLENDVIYTKINRFKHKCVSYDYDLKKKLIFYSKMFRESTTDTDNDPEKLNRKLHPENLRPEYLRR